MKSTWQKGKISFPGGGGGGELGLRRGSAEILELLITSGILGMITSRICRGDCLACAIFFHYTTAIT